MGRLRSGGLRVVVAILSLWTISGCGGHRPPGPSPFLAKVNLSPAATTSVQLGTFIVFTASAQNAAGNNVATTFTFASSDTSILNISPNGVGCAGIWDAAFTTCTPGGIGAVQVTASAGGVSSPPSFVFVHPQVDNITVTGILPDGLPIQEPCLSQSQSMTIEAHAFSQGTDVTASVGPFSFSANNPSVVGLTPIVNPAYSFATNQALAKAVTPGITQIHASASGISSTTFRQPDLSKNAPITFDFFETCPIQNISLEIGHAGSEQTNFSVSKGTSETIIATVTDVMGNNSLANSNNGIVLNKIPLIWTASQPAVVAVGAGCTQSCSITTPSIGAGSVTASCSPPTCNVGFPQIPAAFSPASLATCEQYIHTFFPQITTCEPFIPLPVYASPVALQSTAAISGLVTGSGTPSPVSILASSLGCLGEAPATCTTGIYSFSSAKASTNVASGMPVAPNSLMFDLQGDKVYVGSAFGAQILNPSNLGSQTNPFSSLGTVTGRVLAVSLNGTAAVFSDTIHTPNQVYIVNASNAAAPGSTALNISGASAAAFSPDGLKTLIFGFDSNGSPNLYVYSTQQALQTIPLPAQTSVNSIAFSTNGAFAYIVEPSLAGGGPAFTVYNTCDNKISTDKPVGGTDQVLPLSATPISFKALPDGVHFIVLESDGNFEYFSAAITGIPVATPDQAAKSICPMFVTHAPARKINLGQGTIHPINFFVSGDGTLLYVVASDRSSILVYNFSSGSVSGIQLLGSDNPTPVTADMSVDGSTLLIGASDGMLHEISTAFDGSDNVQLTFPNLANFQNPFCTFDPTSGPCTLDVVLAKP